MLSVVVVVEGVCCMSFGGVGEWRRGTRRFETSYRPRQIGLKLRWTYGRRAGGCGLVKGEIHRRNSATSCIRTKLSAEHAFFPTRRLARTAEQSAARTDERGGENNRRPVGRVDFHVSRGVVHRCARPSLVRKTRSRFSDRFRPEPT